MGQLSRAATVSFGILQTVGESGSEEELVKKMGGKNCLVFSFIIVSSVSTELKFFQLQTCSLFSIKTEKNKIENSLKIVRCNGPKQGNRNTVEE